MGLVESADLIENPRRRIFFIERNQGCDSLLVASGGGKDFISVHRHDLIPSLQLLDLIQQRQTFVRPAAAHVNICQLIIEIRPGRIVPQQFFIAGDTLGGILPVIDPCEIVVIAIPVIARFAFHGFTEVPGAGLIVAAIEPGHTEIVPKGTFTGILLAQGVQLADDGIVIPVGIGLGSFEQGVIEHVGFRILRRSFGNRQEKGRQAGQHGEETPPENLTELHTAKIQKTAWIWRISENN